MKKAISLLMALVFCLSLAGCVVASSGTPDFVALYQEYCHKRNGILAGTLGGDTLIITAQENPTLIQRINVLGAIRKVNIALDLPRSLFFEMLTVDEGVRVFDNVTVDWSHPDQSGTRVLFVTYR